MVEKFNRTHKIILSIFVKENQKDVNEHHPYLTMAYRCAQHESTKLTRNMLMLGREINLPVDLVVHL